MPDAATQPLMPSILDRLVDPASHGTAERPWYGMAEMLRAVGRDFSDLLNTHQTHRGLLDDLPEVRRSLLTYGFPDLGSLDAFTSAQRAQIGRAIEDVVRRFEPRLKDVRVVPDEPADPRRRAIRYRIEARLRVEPAPDVSLEAYLELTTGQYSVKATSP